MAADIKIKITNNLNTMIISLRSCCDKENKQISAAFYYTVMCRAQYFHGKSSVCLSVCDIEVSWSQMLSMVRLRPVWMTNHPPSVL